MTIKPQNENEWNNGHRQRVCQRDTTNHRYSPQQCRAQRGLLPRADVLEFYPIASTLRTQLNWSQYKLLIAIPDKDKREYYELEAVHEGWTKRQLERQINSLLCERLLILVPNIFHPTDTPKRIIKMFKISVWNVQISCQKYANAVIYQNLWIEKSHTCCSEKCLRGSKRNMWIIR